MQGTFLQHRMVLRHIMLCSVVVNKYRQELPHDLSFSQLTPLSLSELLTEISSQQYTSSNYRKHQRREMGCAKLCRIALWDITLKRSALWEWALTLFRTSFWEHGLLKSDNVIEHWLLNALSCGLPTADRGSWKNGAYWSIIQISNLVTLVTLVASERLMVSTWFNTFNNSHYGHG